jgi:hypothetical protein
MQTLLTTISILLFYLSLPAALALAVVALMSLFAFGGAQRNALALLATGVYCVITGAVYLYGVAASYYALQDNAYLGNIYLGLLLLLVGAPVLLAGGLAGAGLPRWAAVGLSLVGLAGLVGVYRSIGLDLPYGGQFVIAYLALALVVMVGALLALRRANLVGAALGLGALGAVAALALYTLFGVLFDGGSLAVYLQFGVDHSLANKPPVLEGFGALAMLLLAIAVFLAGRRGGGLAGATVRSGVAPA